MPAQKIRRLVFTGITLYLCHVFMLGGLLRGLTTNHAEMEPTKVVGTPSQVADRISDAMDSDWKWNIVSRASADGVVTVVATRTTRVLKFVDDVTIMLKPIVAPQSESVTEQSGTEVTARSQSRVGNGDLGQNLRNLRQLDDWTRSFARFRHDI